MPASLLDQSRFQFTLPRGERRHVSREQAHIDVSIHAPARGATVPVRTIMQVKSFQFTLPRGERLGDLNQAELDLSFNSRSREGSDIIKVCTDITISRFNSRSREGSDQDCRHTGVLYR